VVVFGASGRTGRLLVEQALAAGHAVTAFVRDPARLPVTHARLRVVRGDVRDPQRVAEAVAGQDAVLSALGPNKPEFDAMALGARHILAAMGRHGVRFGIAQYLAAEVAARGAVAVPLELPAAAVGELAAKGARRAWSVATADAAGHDETATSTHAGVPSAPVAPTACAPRWRCAGLPLKAAETLALATRLSPRPHPYGAAGVNNGAAWPEDLPNLRISDPAQPLPQAVARR
jgi:uncharacterized protein YbjT (DUF2867 family)